MFWTYDRTHRLQELVARAREQERFLLRERCDTHDVISLAVIDRRLATVQGRLRALYAAARGARRAARAMATAD